MNTSGYCDCVGASYVLIRGRHVEVMLCLDAGTVCQRAHVHTNDRIVAHQQSSSSGMRLLFQLLRLVLLDTESMGAERCVIQRRIIVRRMHRSKVVAALHRSGGLAHTAWFASCSTGTVLSRQMVHTVPSSRMAQESSWCVLYHLYASWIMTGNTSPLTSTHIRALVLWHA